MEKNQGGMPVKCQAVSYRAILESEAKRKMCVPIDSFSYIIKRLVFETIVDAHEIVRNNTERSYIPITQFPPVVTIPQPGFYHWYS